MNIKEFLSLRGTRLSDVVKKLDATVKLGAGDLLLAVGSLIEGLGTIKSDVDLILITSREDASALPNNITLVVGTCLIDVRLLRFDELYELLVRFERWSKLPWNVTYAVKFTLDDRTLLHRLLHGKVLHKGKRNQVTRRIPRLSDLARLKFHVARQMARTIQVDMVGYRETGDYRSLVFASQEVLGHAVDALLASYDLTNPLLKWRSRLLEFVPADWERGLIIRPTGLSAGEQIWRLHRAPQKPDKRLASEHAFRVTTFARAVFMRGEVHLINGSVRSPKLNVPRTPANNRIDAALPYLDYDIDFSLTNGRVLVARLNEFDEQLNLSRREFALTLLFDGTTTAREAERMVYGSQGGMSKVRAVDRLVSRMVRSGLTVFP